MSSDSITVRINGTRSVSTERGQTLLEGLRKAGIYMQSACGGRGACGTCAVKVISESLAPLTASEKHWLTSEQKQSGTRLACQICLDSDIEISLPESVFEVRKFRAAVESIRHLTWDVKEVRLKLLDPPKLTFQAGQYIQLQIPPYNDHSTPIYRSYSIASNPLLRNHIELHVKHVPNGAATKYIHQHMKVGEHVTFFGPHGQLHLRPSRRDIIFIAGAPGMAPLHSMLLDLLNTGETRRARFFHGAKSRRDLVLCYEMEEFELALPDFEYIPALSEPAAGDNWQCDTGLITDVVKRYVKNGPDCDAYLCGSPPMIAACLKMLKEIGVPDNCVHYDQFV